MTTSPRLRRALTALVRAPLEPRAFMTRVVDAVRRVSRERRGDPETRRFIAHNRRAWGDWRVARPEAMILADFYTISETNLARSYFLNVLARRHRAAIHSFQDYGGDRWLHKVYRSFNTVGHVVPKLSAPQATRARALFAAARPSVRSTQDLYDLTVNGIWIGVDVYESYLRAYSRATVDLDDAQLWAYVELAIGLVVFWQDVFAGPTPVAAVVTSHDCYVNSGVVCKVAWANAVPVYSPNPIYMVHARKPYTAHSHFWRYRQLFKELPAAEQEAGLALAKRQMARRFSGEVGVDMPYSTKSAFGPVSEQRVLRRSDKLKVLICTHCFFDNPHAYGGMLFVDFLAWVRFLGRVSERTDYEWYLKTHPDPLPGTDAIVQQILDEFPGITRVPTGTSHHQLASEGLDVALTVYGSIGHEYPALGVQVVNAGFNPHVAYDFGWHPRSVEEYESLLLNLRTLRRPADVDALAEFYFMHYYYRFDDDLVFNSYRRFEASLTPEQRLGPAAYSYFLNELTDARHRAIIETMEKFIDSGKSHHFSGGPVDGGAIPGRVAPASMPAAAAR